MSSTVSSASAGTSEKKRPIVWMIVAGVAILAAIGFGIWAFKTNSDLKETQADRDAQKAATLQAPAVNGAGVLLVKTAGDPALLANAVRAAIREQDPLLAVFGVEPLERCGRRLARLLSAGRTLAG